MISKPLTCQMILKYCNFLNELASKFFFKQKNKTFLKKHYVTIIYSYWNLNLNRSESLKKN